MEEKPEHHPTSGGSRCVALEVGPAVKHFTSWGFPLVNIVRKDDEKVGFIVLPVDNISRRKTKALPVNNTTCESRNQSNQTHEERGGGEDKASAQISE